MDPSRVNQWMRGVRRWAHELARRRRRQDLADDIEGAAIEYLVAHELVGAEIPAELEQYLTRALELGDSFSTARDSDLTAHLNEDVLGDGHVSSWLETLAADPDPEERLLSVLDQEERVEGRDQAELLEEIDDVSADLSLEEDQFLSLRQLYGYTQRELGQYLGIDQTTVSKREMKLKRRLQVKRELKELRTRMEADRSFTQLEVSWIRI